MQVRVQILILRRAFVLLRVSPDFLAPALQACRLTSLPKLPKAFKTVEKFIHYMVYYHVLPEDIVSDRGSQFTSQV